MRDTRNSLDILRVVSGDKAALKIVNVFSCRGGAVFDNVQFFWRRILFTIVEKQKQPIVVMRCFWICASKVRWGDHHEGARASQAHGKSLGGTRFVGVTTSSVTLRLRRY